LESLKHFKNNNQKQMKTFKYLTIAVLMTTAIFSCRKEEITLEEPHHDPTYGSLMIRFENKVGVDPLVLNWSTYTNNTDSFNVTTFNYYISNVKLHARDGSTTYLETESYHLIKADDASTLQFTLTNVPAKSYSSITFMIGVDSLRNVSGAQTGALDPNNGHFWSWSSGYIMAKFEGTSPQSTATGNVVVFHVGGFSGTNSSLKTITLPLTSDANVSTSTTPQVFLKADLAEWFAPNAVSFGTLNTVHMPGANAKKIADNYENMFSVTQVLN
jgi:hypothetical protein